MKITFYFAALISIISIATACNNNTAKESKGNVTAISNEPKQLNYTITASYPHDPNSFTEGFEWRDGFLYEGKRSEQHPEYEINPNCMNTSLMTVDELNERMWLACQLGDDDILEQAVADGAQVGEMNSFKRRAYLSRFTVELPDFLTPTHSRLSPSLVPYLCPSPSPSLSLFLSLSLALYLSIYLCL